MKFLNKKNISSLAAALLLSFGYVASASAVELCSGVFYRATANTVCSTVGHGVGGVNVIFRAFAEHKGGVRGYTVFVNLTDQGNNVRVAAAANPVNTPSNWSGVPSTIGYASFSYTPLKGRTYTVTGGLNFEKDKSTNGAITSRAIVSYEFF